MGANLDAFCLDLLRALFQAVAGGSPCLFHVHAGQAHLVGGDDRPRDRNGVNQIDRGTKSLRERHSALGRLLGVGRKVSCHQDSIELAHCVASTHSCARRALRSALR